MVAPAEDVPPRDSEAAVPTRRADDPAALGTPRRRRWPLVVLATLLAVAALGALGAYLFAQRLPGMAAERAVAGAKERGFDLGFGAIDVEGILPWDDRPAALVLRGVKAHNVAAPDVVVEVQLLRVELARQEPIRVAATGVRVAAPDVVSLLAFEDALREGRAKEIPIAVEGVHIAVGRVAEALPVAVEMTLARASADRGVLTLTDAKMQPSIPFVDLGVPSVSVTIERGEDRVWVRPADLQAARIGLNRAASRAYLEVDGLVPATLPRWIPVELPGKSLSGTLELSLAGADALSGKFDAKVQGYVPPHPRELNGVLFGTTTKASGKLRVDGWAVALEELVVEAGALKMKGSGRLGLTGSLTMDLAGSVPCSDVAASVVGAHLGFGGSILTRRLASGRLGGTVEARVHVEADVRDLERARIGPSASLHCKIVL